MATRSKNLAQERFGIIDLGSNSVRFDVYEFQSKNRANRLIREKVMVRLGQGVFLDQKLHVEAVGKTLRTFDRFKKIIQKLAVKKVVAVATSALRDASDSDELIQEVRDKTGIRIRVISGQKEAELIAKGVLCFEKQLLGQFALVDIGGGSTEITICRDKRILNSASFDLGAARIQQVILRGNPPLQLDRPVHPVVQARRHIRRVLLSRIDSEQWPTVPQILGSSGTIRALLQLEQEGRGEGEISKKWLEKIIETMSDQTQTELLRIPGMERRRVDLILAGAILLDEIMDILGAKKVLVTKFSLRDGVLAEFLHRRVGWNQSQGFKIRSSESR